MLESILKLDKSEAEALDLILSKIAPDMLGELSIELPWDKAVDVCANILTIYMQLHGHKFGTGNWDQGCLHCCSTGCNHEDWTHSSAYKVGTTLCYTADCPQVK